MEGFVFALTPFNFTAIAGNLPTSVAMMGNTVVWKPANSQVYAANVIMQVLKEAGLPDGVINLIYVSGPDAGDVIFNHKDFAGIHFTGSTGVFQNIWKTIGNNIHKYRSYPRIVGETGGKDFVIAHKSANPKEVSTALSRGAFEYQGQKCSAASRAYIPSNIWDQAKQYLIEDLKSFKMGPTEDFGNFSCIRSTHRHVHPSCTCLRSGTSASCPSTSRATYTRTGSPRGGSLDRMHCLLRDHGRGVRCLRRARSPPYQP